MRAFVFLLLLIASGASAQSGLSLGVGPATGLGSAAMYSEVRGNIALTSFLSIEPALGVRVEAGREFVDPYPCDRCGTTTTIGQGGSTNLTLGGVLTLQAPTRMLPKLLAGAHVGLITQWEERAYERGAVRYGVEAGAAFQPTPGLRVSGALQAVRLARSREYSFGLSPVSLVPMLRLGYTPEARDRQASGDARRARYSVASGVATGFEAGAVQTELRASVPIGAVLAVEPSVAYTSASAYDEFPRCSPDVECASRQRQGADALSFGLGVTAHSGRFRAAGVPLADAYVGTALYVVSPLEERPDEGQLTLLVGGAIPIARGLALGAEVQASTYGTSSEGRDQVSIAPMLRLTVGG